MKYKDFEDYLQTKHAECNTDVRDDDMPDDYERWLEDIGVEGVIRYADTYANKYAFEKMQEMAEKMIDSISYKKTEEAK